MDLPTTTKQELSREEKEKIEKVVFRDQSHFRKQLKSYIVNGV